MNNYILGMYEYETIWWNSEAIQTGSHIGQHYEQKPGLSYGGRGHHCHLCCQFPYGGF